MTIVFRTDSSLAIGTGHVTRCLTLAECLRAQGAEAVFVCRSWPGDAAALIESAGFALYRLPRFDTAAYAASDDYAAWLGVTQEQDARETLSASSGLAHPIDWLVVDHYGIDAEWHQVVRPHVTALMVIDDLANRPLDCDLLLDQNLSAQQSTTRYEQLVPPVCRMLLGPEIALLRPEFLAARESTRARDGRIRRLFVFFGGVDAPNVTGRTLCALQSMGDRDIDVDVVLGASNPHREELRRLCATLPRVTCALQVTDMATRMAKADLALGAGGTTTWERCGVGLPSIVVALAENQLDIGRETQRLGVGVYLGHERDITADHIESALRWAFDHPADLRRMSETAMQLVDGRGAERVARALVGRGARESVA